mmetsp:Transcript_107515/g.342831  ORF Transcript_107515/g.342831 Transcript_107515/m.342831 type:complete len:271 (-) Transcript_107515:5368-6180(-)
MVVPVGKVVARCAILQMPLHLMEGPQSHIAGCRYMVNAADRTIATRVRTTRRLHRAATLANAVEVTVRATVPRDSLCPHGVENPPAFIPNHGRQVDGPQVFWVQQRLPKICATTRGRHTDRVKAQREQPLHSDGVLRQFRAMLPRRARIFSACIRPATHPPHPLQLRLHPCRRTLLDGWRRYKCRGHGGRAAATLHIEGQTAGEECGDTFCSQPRLDVHEPRRILHTLRRFLQRLACACIGLAQADLKRVQVRRSVAGVTDLLCHLGAGG